MKAGHTRYATLDRIHVWVEGWGPIMLSIEGGLTPAEVSDLAPTLSAAWARTHSTEHLEVLVKVRWPGARIVSWGPKGGS